MVNLDLIYEPSAVTPPVRRPEEGFYRPLNLFARLLCLFQKNLGHTVAVCAAFWDTPIFSNFQHASGMFSWGGAKITPNKFDTFRKQFGRQSLCLSFEYEKLVSGIFPCANAITTCSKIWVWVNSRIGWLIMLLFYIILTSGVLALNSCSGLGRN